MNKNKQDCHPERSRLPTEARRTKVGRDLFMPMQTINDDG